MDNNQEIVEQEGTYFTDLMLDNSLLTQINKNGKLTLKENEGVHISIGQQIRNKLYRKNLIYFGIMEGEAPVKIEQATYNFQASLVNTEQIRRRLERIKEKNKIGYIHIGTIQIILKSCFSIGINSPLTLEIIDNRINNEQEKILGKIKGNLSYGIIKFNIDLQFGIPLTTNKFNNAIGVRCNFERKDLMNEGDIPFSVNFGVTYALTNSNLSIIFKQKERIYTDELFEQTSTFIQNNQILDNFRKSISESRRFLPSSSQINMIEDKEEHKDETNIETMKILPPLRNKSKNENNTEAIVKQLEALTKEIKKVNDKI